ncbi:hypothetical protein PoB_006383500, partial [Plakobranchus ocellatus]
MRPWRSCNVGCSDDQSSKYLSFTASADNGGPVSWLTDTDDITCRNESQTKLELSFQTREAFFWIRMISKRTDSRDFPNISYDKYDNGTETVLDCPHDLEIHTFTWSADFWCEMTENVDKIFLTLGDTQLCTVYISEGTPCLHNTYGPGCDEICNCARKSENASSERVCFSRSGRCLYGCAAGYVGDKCEE